MPVLDTPHGTVVDSTLATALLDAMTDATAVLNPDGVIVAVNRAWQMFCLDNDGTAEDTGIGVNYLHVCERAAAAGCTDAQVALAGLRAVLAKETVERSLDYECSSPTVVRWFMLRITPVNHPGLGALVSHTNITRRRAVERGMPDGGSLDPVTLLSDRDQLAGWLRSGHSGWLEATASGDVGMVHLHVDAIDWIADTFGGAAHDDVLQAIARRLAAVVRPGDMIARVGDQEFTIAAPRMTATGLAGLLARVRHALAGAFSIHGHEVDIGARAGTHLAAPGDDLMDCLRLADESSYSIKVPRRPGDRPALLPDRTTTGQVSADDRTEVAGAVVGPDRPHRPGDLPQQEDAGLVPAGAVRRLPDPSDRARWREEDSAREVKRLQELNTALELTLAERTTELQLRACEVAQMTRQLEDFANSVSHDLRAPLRAMVGFARILVEDHSGYQDSEARRCLERIQASALEMGQQLDGLLVLSRLQRRRLNPTRLDMSSMVRRTWERVRPTDRQVHFHVGDLPDARGDEALVDQLIEHLLENAVKFTAGVLEPRIAVSADTVDGSVRYVVEDNGVGFDMCCAGRLFSPLQRMHPAHEYPGIGIGLALAQQIVRRHGGSIDANAVPGQGARFRFTLGPASL